MLVQASDRRVTTSENGIRDVVDDERNKAIYLHCRNAQACVSFAGVARIGDASLRPEVIQDGRVSYPIKYFTDQDLFQRYWEVTEKLGLPRGYSGPLVLGETEDDDRSVEPN